MKTPNVFAGVERLQDVIAPSSALRPTRNGPIYTGQGPGSSPWPDELSFGVTRTIYDTQADIATATEWEQRSSKLFGVLGILVGAGLGTIVARVMFPAR